MKANAVRVDPEIVSLVKAIRRGAIQDDLREDNIVNAAIAEIEEVRAIGNCDSTYHKLFADLREMGILFD